MTTTQCTLLLIDDSKTNLSLLTGVLGLEYRILVAENGKDGIELAHSELPDLILLDISMPDMDGYVVCAELKKAIQTRNIPIIFLTAMNHLEDETKGLELGAVDYITKPFSMQIVKVRVRNHLELKVYRDRLMRLSMIDGLTSIANRRQFDRTLAQEWLRGTRKKTQLSLLMLDIDYFKQFNDCYGHLEGDDCLKQVVRTIKQQLERPLDLVARYGGEEFVCVLPETDVEGAVHIAKCIINQMKKLAIVHEGSAVASYVTLSIGVICTVPKAGYAINDFIDSADRALYHAKKAGRNGYEVGKLNAQRPKVIAQEKV